MIKLGLLAMMAGGLGLMFQQQLTAYLKERIEEWREKDRRRRRERDRNTTSLPGE